MRTARSIMVTGFACLAWQATKHALSWLEGAGMTTRHCSGGRGPGTAAGRERVEELLVPPHCLLTALSTSSTMAAVWLEGRRVITFESSPSALAGAAAALVPPSFDDGGAPTTRRHRNDFESLVRPRRCRDRRCCVPPCEPPPPSSKARPDAAITSSAMADDRALDEQVRRQSEEDAET